MTAIFLYLTLCSLRNQVLRWLRRLRQPRYALGLLAGLAYFYFSLIRPRFSEPKISTDMIGRLEDFRPQVELLVATVLGGRILLAWLFPLRKSVLEFSKAEVQFFFTAPIPKRMLIHYKLLRSQLGILLGSLVLSFFTGRLSDPRRWPLVAGFWVMFATLHLHLIVAGLVNHGISQLQSPRRYRVAIWLAGALLLCAFFWTITPVLVGFSGTAQDLPKLGRELVEASQTLPLSALVFPFRVALSPLLAVNFREFLWSLAPAMLLLVVHYLCAVNLRVAFEEAAAEAAEKKARLKELFRARDIAPPGKRKAPFGLKPQGRPEIALCWKNWILAARFWTVRRLLGLGLIALVVSIGLLGVRRSVAPALLFLLLSTAGVLPIFGSLMLRNDLRGDLLQLEVIKTFPLSGRAVVVGEILAPWLCLALVQWMLIAIAWVVSFWTGSSLSWSNERNWLFLSAAALAPAVTLLGVLIQNAVALIFPAWASLGKTHSTPVEAIGQNMVLMLATMIAMLALLLVPAVAGGAAGVASYWLIGIPGVLVGSVAAALAMLVESAVAAELLGKLFERTDPQQVERSDQ